MTSARDFSLDTPGGPLDLAQFAGHPILVVNTASLCGFTPQYAGLQALYTEYKPRGLVVLAVPSNDFGRQEPGDPTVCTTRFATSFPVAAKAHVTGKQAIPLFQWLAQEAGALGRPRWNFYKYLIDRDGSLSTWFGSITKPESTKLRGAIERVLAQP